MRKSWVSSNGELDRANYDVCSAASVQEIDSCDGDKSNLNETEGIFAHLPSFIEPALNRYKVIFEKSTSILTTNSVSAAL